MFPELIRKDREVQGGHLDILAQADWCTLALNSPMGYPYLIAVNHVVAEDKLYFHCAQAGFKLDCLANDARVCVQAVVRAAVVAGDYTTDYLSVVAFGRARLVEDESSRRQILARLMERFSPGHAKAASCARDGASSTAIVEITIEHSTAKENKAL